MSITFQCEHCHKEVKAPDTAAGKRGKCPHCQQSCYIPAPVSDDELYDVAPLDEDGERQREEELHRIREQEKELLAADKDAPSEPLEQRDDVAAEDLHHLVVNYCLALAGSKLPQAGDHAKKLRSFGAEGVQAVNDFLSGGATEPALDNIPAPVREGFLKQLREQL
jgi:hypothetical protein